MRKDQAGLDATSCRRREFLGRAATVGVFGGLGCLGVLGLARELTASTFEPYIGNRFRVHGARNGPLDVELIEAYAQPYDPNRPAHVRREPFTLIFRAAEGQFEDQTCTISHPRLGAVETSLFRVDMPKQGMNLQAIFG